MNKQRITWRIVLWFAGILVLLTFLSLITLHISSMRQAARYAQEVLTSTMDYAIDNIELKDGMIYLDNDLDDSAAPVLLYSENGIRQLYGPLPAFDLPFQEGPPRQVAGDEGSTWQVYDRLHPLGDGVFLWVRTCIAMDSITSVAEHNRQVYGFLFLPLLLLGLGGGYLITRRALRPMQKMAAAARRIADGRDLSLRIGLESDDEFGELSAVLDHMLSRLEDAFLQEKRFTADASHELRTPLSVIRAQCDLAQKAGTAEAQAEALAVISRQTDRLSRMIRELLALSRMDSNTQQLSLEEVDLCMLLPAVVEELEETAQKKTITIHTKLPETCQILADEAMLLRLFINLIANAIRFGRPGGHVWISLQDQQTQVTCRIKDDGIGMDETVLPHIFRRFYQADPARSSDDGSSGLGLAMVDWIVKSHGGSIHVTSAPGEGSEFCLMLPKHP